MVTAYIGLGTNVGDRVGYCRKALHQIRLLGVVRSISGLYETDPMYVTDQAPFLNLAVQLDTEMGPLQLLFALKRIERELGRQRTHRYGPREIDLDLLAYGVLSLQSQRIAVPHPRMPERRFVLQPLNDLNPELVLPGLGKVNDLWAATSDQADTVRKVEYAGLSLPIHGSEWENP